MNFTIKRGDSLTVLRELRAESVQMCCTSPPYWGLRDYGVRGQLGLERTPDEYVSKMVEVFREVRRVLRKDGTLWLNIGDSYAADKCGRADADRNNVDGFTGGQKFKGEVFSQRSAPDGMKPKDLCGIPWMLAFALRADGWYLRSDIIWHKPNPMPESVTDRPTKSHEYLFLLAKSGRYFYDSEAVKEAAVCGKDLGLLRGKRSGADDSTNVAWHTKSIRQRQNAGVDSRVAGTGFRNKRTVWSITTQPYSGAHFATFPEKLIEPCILAGSKPGDRILDCFAGSGTTGVVALRHKRKFIGIELSAQYARMAERRITA